MAYDEKLTQRFRDALGTTETITEQKMMGGICFLYRGNMLGGADRQKSGQGRFMFRVGKDNQETALARDHAMPMELGGHRMKGFVFVDAQHCDKASLKDWIDFDMRFVKTLPAK